jgi:hypothetical protein
VPDAIAPQDPAFIDEGECDPPRQTKLGAVAVVLIADHEPQRTGCFETAANLGEDLGESFDVFLRRVFLSDLRLLAVIVPLLVIGGTGDDGIDEVRGPGLEEGERIAAVDGVWRWDLVDGKEACAFYLPLLGTPGRGPG